MTLSPDPRIRLAASGDAFILYFVGSFIRVPANPKGLLLMKAILHARQAASTTPIKIAEQGRPIRDTVDAILKHINPSTTQKQVEAWLAAGGQIKRRVRRKAPPAGLTLADLDL